MTQFESVLRSERERLAKKMEAIDVLLAGEPSQSPPRMAAVHHSKGRVVSAAVREKIRRTQKARWEKIRREKKRA
jgi:hypothetical protein